MEQLLLRLSSEADGWDIEQTEWWRLDFTTTLAAGLAACGMHGRLQELSLELDIDCSIHLGSWMAPLTSLQRLIVTLGNGLIILAGSLRCLSALQHLSIAAFPHSFNTSTMWQAGSALPPSLTSLCLGGELGAMLPSQVRISRLGWVASAGDNSVTWPCKRKRCLPRWAADASVEIIRWFCKRRPACPSASCGLPIRVPAQLLPRNPLHVPPQAAVLTNLRQLVLLPHLEPSEDEEDDGPWERLCSLTCLRMSGFSTRAPRCLGALTQLRSLQLARPRGDELFSSAEAELLHGALPVLQHLTHLGLELVLLSPPASLASLRQLRSFGFLSYEDPDDAEDPGQLPAGPWVAGLQRLAGSCSLLTASLPVLEAASQLQELGLLVVADSQQLAALSILQWAAGRPALRRVSVDCLGRSGGSVRRAVDGAAQQLPQLTLSVCQLDDHPWLDEYDWQGVFPDLPPVPRSP